MSLDVVILAAGKGTRMRSNHAKVLHTLAGRSLLQHVVTTALTLQPQRLAVVVGHQAQEVMQHLGDGPVWVEQAEQLGTGHAVQLALQALPATDGADVADGAEKSGAVLILYGDVPMVSQHTLSQAIDAAAAGQVGLVTAEFDDPAELGRIVRDAEGQIQRIVEFKDASENERQLQEINSGIMAVPASRLREWLTRVEPHNAQGEYYLTDIIEFAVADGVPVVGVVAATPEEVTGVNDRAQLAELERIYQRRQAQRLMAAGVTIADPERVDIRGDITAGQDCFIDINVVLEGTVELGEGVHIGPGAVICDSAIGSGTEVHPHTVVEGSTVAANCSLGPFARIRPGTRLDDEVKIGNFVETKKSHLGPGTKASHLAYLGDATLGAGVNVGAGTVTCNYDGINKHPTIIGDGVFVGTNTTLVAPLEIAEGAFVAAGSSVTVKVESGDLAIGRAKQRNIKGWTRPDQRQDKDQ